MNFYTYAHRRNDTGAVFYVGKGRGGRAASFGDRNRHWRHVVSKHGRTVEILAKWPTEAEAFEHERFLIACFRDLGAPLVNMTDGGEGVVGHVPTQETREKMRAAHLGKRHSAERCAKIGDAKRAQWADPVTRKNMLEARQAKGSDPACRANMSAAQYARWARDADARARHSAVLRDRLADPEVRAKITAANLGRRLTAEAKARIGAAARARAAARKSGV